MAKAREILKQYWGHSTFRVPQEEIIQAVLAGKDVLALLPTGGGKSACFQVPTLLLEGVCIVVTPLIALMQDQVAQLKKKGIYAYAVHSGMSHRELDITLDNCIYGQVKFLYLSPERLLTELFRERFKKMKVCLVAIDEAHCISQWGYDFRPPYLQIAELRDLKPNVPFIALTASATRMVKNDIADKLRLKDAAIFQRSVVRENLSFVVRNTENKEKKLIEVLRKVQGTAIIYVRSRKATQDLSRWLNKQGIKSTFYNAGLTHEERSGRQQEWVSGLVRVMVSTNAFGMGIDKADVRTVIHMDLPENLEAYYQEAGRAGRDGKRSFAVLIFHDADVLALDHKIQQSQPGLEYLKKIYQALANYYQLAMGSSEGESFDFELEEFCKRFNLKSSAVYPALKKLEEAGLIQLSESFYRPSRLHFSIDKKKLYDFQVANEKYDPLIKALLRLYGGELFTEFIGISENQIGKALKLSAKRITDDLLKLSKLQLLNYELTSDKPQVSYILPRQDVDHLPIDISRLEGRRKLILEKKDAMIAYVTQSHRCRMEVIQEYFDEVALIPCGICDVCIEKRKKENQTVLRDYREQIIYLLKQKPVSAEDLEAAVSPHDQELFVDVLREMVDNGDVAYDEFWVLHLK